MKDSFEYVKNHDFGYGKSMDKIKINKILLRDIEDLKVYLNVLCHANFFFKNGLILDKENDNFISIKLKKFSKDKF